MTNRPIQPLTLKRGMGLIYIFSDSILYQALYNKEEVHF